MMKYKSPCFMKDDCACGYAKNNTQSCQQKECDRYIRRELRCAKFELDHDMKKAHEDYIQRIENILN